MAVMGWGGMGVGKRIEAEKAKNKQRKGGREYFIKLFSAFCFFSLAGNF